MKIKLPEQTLLSAIGVMLCRIEKKSGHKIEPHARSVLVKQLFGILNHLELGKEYMEHEPCQKMVKHNLDQFLKAINSQPIKTFRRKRR
jgi:hypothetical protein